MAKKDKGVCPNCEGQRIIWIMRFDGGRASHAIRPKQCSICNGTGFIGLAMLAEEQKELRLEVPPPEYHPTDPMRAEQ